MTIGVSQVVVHVEDQQRAVDFWAGKMGFEVTTDAPYGEDRWIEVEPPGGGVRLVLSRADPDLPTDQPHYVLFHADDLVKEHAELVARGVEFTEAPTRQPWGWSAVFKDPEGHLFHLGQR